jgi:hypothetical protein
VIILVSSSLPKNFGERLPPLSAILRCFSSQSLIISLPLSDLVGKISDMRGDLDPVAEYEFKLTKRGLISFGDARVILD